MKPVWTMRRHALAWSVLGCLALVYIWNVLALPIPSLDFISPSVLFAKREKAPDPALAAREERPAAPKAGFGVQTRKPLARDGTLALREEIEILRRRVEKLKRREETLNERVSIIESAFGPATSALPPHGDPNPAGRRGSPAKKVSAPAPAADISYLPLPTEGFGDIAAAGSPLPVAGVKKPTRTLFGVELATAASSEALKKKWNTLASAHKGLLGELEVRGREAGSGTGGARMTLIAGPFPNAADAARLCAKLKAARVACTETVFTGKAL